MKAQAERDARFMAACLRMALAHRARTGSNPSVGTLLARGERIVGRGVTALGGRPHAEPVAIAEAGEAARGATAYVTLEPCAHHGVTPPCARALIDAGVIRVVTAWTDPDARVDGEGHAMLRRAGIQVTTGVLAEQAAADLAGYLARKTLGRPHVTLKLAVSADGALGQRGRETPITGALARRYVHRMRADHDAILVGRGTVQADDPALTVRLPGLEDRSPARFLLADADALDPGGTVVRTSRQVATFLVTGGDLASDLAHAGLRRFAAERHEGRVALPELLDDLACAGHSRLMVEGGAAVAEAFLAGGLVDEIALFSAPHDIGGEAVFSPLAPRDVPAGFRSTRRMRLGEDELHLMTRLR